jgi:ATP-dependent RNA helicase DeaD
MNEFKELGLNEDMVKAINRENITIPTEIQQKTIPLVLEGKDIIAGSATGSGKTLAFGAGILQNIEKGKGIQSLILTPTRELAEQVSESLISFSPNRGIKVVPVYGGVSINGQIEKLPKADIVVGTPGRILDHLDRNTINLRNVKILVLDEADRMLDMGFIKDVETILKSCPKERQTLFFTATVSKEIKRLSKYYMKEPISVSVECYIDPNKLKQIYYNVSDQQKFSLLYHLLKKDSLNVEKEEIIMIFCNTQRSTDFVADNLRENGIKATAIHGGLTQQKRNHIIERFHNNKFNVLVCTDVAARGLDIQDVSIIYNFDIPNEPKQYIHRIGRTARAGKEGIAINILSPRDHQLFTKVLQENEVKIIKEPTPEFEKVRFSMKNNNSSSSRGGFSRSRDDDRSSGRRPSFRRDSGDRERSSERRPSFRRDSGDRERSSERKPSFRRDSGDRERSSERKPSFRGSGDRERTSERRTSFKGKSGDRERSSERRTSFRRDSGDRERSSERKPSFRGSGDRERTSERRTSFKGKSGDRERTSERRTNNKPRGENKRRERN